MSEQDFNELIFGQVGRVVAVENDGMVFHVRLKEGHVGRVAASSKMDVEPGDAVIINDTQWQKIPLGVWFDERAVGVIRKIEDDRILLESALGLRYVPNKTRLEVALAVGNTVEFDEYNGIVKIISETPIRMRDGGVDEDDISQYLIKPGGGDASLSFDAFGGYQDVRDRARELIETQLNKRDALDAIGARPVKGIIFTGPPGTGKTYLARIIAQESKATFYLVSGPSIVSKWVGDSEETLRRIFEAAAQESRAIVFFDEIDSIAERRSDNTHEASKRVVAQLLTLLDGFDQKSSNIVVLAATNRIEDIDGALLRPGRFDWEISFGMPTLTDRLEILAAHAKRVATTGDLPFEEIATVTEGWSAARLSSIWTEAALVAAGDDRQAIADEDLVEGFRRVSKRPVRARVEDEK